MPVIGRLAAKESALQAEGVLTSRDLSCAQSLGSAHGGCEFRPQWSREDTIGEMQQMGPNHRWEVSQT